jgi:hypothetical protein
MMLVIGFCAVLGFAFWTHYRVISAGSEVLKISEISSSMMNETNGKPVGDTESGILGAIGRLLLR